MKRGREEGGEGRGGGDGGWVGGSEGASPGREPKEGGRKERRIDIYICPIFMCILKIIYFTNNALTPTAETQHCYIVQCNYV